jgi:hypothetical protein
MLGIGKRAENKLRENGRAATATVVAVKRGHIGESSGQAYGGQNSTINYHFTVRIEPDGEVPFEAEVSDRILLSNSPTGVGGTIAVLYDPDDHSKVRIDHSTGAVMGNALAGAISPAAMDTIRAAGAGDAMANLLKEATTNPDALLASMRGHDMAADVRAQMTPPPGGGTAPHIFVGGQAFGGTQAAAAPDPVTQLAKLADLHDRGALTDDEFATEKKRVLGE